MNKILILSHTKNDLVTTVLNTCEGARWSTPRDIQSEELSQYDALCVLAGDQDRPYTLPAPLRTAAEEMREAGKPVFCEFINSIGPVYSAAPTGTTHHRMIYSDAYVQVEGMTKGDVLDGHGNEIIPYYFAPDTILPILTYHDYICAHDRLDMEDAAFRSGKLALWKLDGNTLISSIRLCNFNRARLAPRDSWEKILAYILSFLAGCPVTPVFPEAVCRHNCGKEIKTASDTRDMARRGLEWIRNADILLENGKNGVLEGFSHQIMAKDGEQLVAEAVRADCTGEIGGAFLLDYLCTGNRESLETFRNTLSFCFDKMQIKQGLHKGMLRWTEIAWMVCYQDDVARAILPALLWENFGEGSEYFRNAVEALTYLTETTGEDGLRAARTDCPQLTEESLKALKVGKTGIPCAHYNAWYHAALLLAARAGGPAEFAEVAEKGLSSIMALYPDTQRETSETEELCRLVFPLAVLYEYTRKEEHYRWLLQVTTDLEKVQHPSGGYAEWDTGYKAACARNNQGECALLANNGDPVADLLYSNNWLPLGFAYAYLATGEEKFRQKWQEICTFLSHCQIHSHDPKLNGAWTRAMDMNRMEAYGVPHDVGWAPCCIESGWTVGEILMGVQFMHLAEKLT